MNRFELREGTSTNDQPLKKQNTGATLLSIGTTIILAAKIIKHSLQATANTEK
jgi:hypothetical protein